MKFFRIILFISFFVLAVLSSFLAVAQTCEEKTRYYEVLDVQDVRPIIPEMKNYIKENIKTISADCKRRLHYLVGVCYEITGSIDSAAIYFNLAAADAKLCKSDTAIAETFINTSGFYLRRGNLPKTRLLLDTANQSLSKHLRSFKNNYNLEGGPSTYVSLEDPIVSANKNANSFKKQFGSTELYLLRSYYQNAGNYYIYTNKPEEAKKNLLLSYQFAKANLLDSTEGNILNNLGLLVSNEGFYLRAVEFLNESLLIAEQQKDTAAMPNTLLNLSFCYRKIKKIKEAEAYAARARNIAQKNGYAAFFCRSSSFLSRALSIQDKVKEAVEIMRQSIDTATKYKLTNELAYNYRALAEIMVQHNYNLPEVLSLTQKSRNIVLEIGDSSFLNSTDITLGHYYLKTRDYAPALKYTLQSIGFCYQFNDYAELDAALKQAAEVYTAMGDYKTANQYLLKYDQIKDSLGNTEIRLSMQDLERKYDNQSKKLQISRLEQDQKEKEFLLARNKSRIRLFVGIAIATLLAALSFLYFNRKLARQKKEVINSNKKLQELTSLQNRLFRIIGHDLKSMILPFSRAGKIMQNYLGKNESANASLYANKLEENAVRLSGTINNLLFWSVQQLDGYQINKEKLWVRDQLDIVLEPFDELIRLKNIDFINLIKKEESLITDKEAFQIILRNIISNSIKFTDRGAITVSSIADPSFYTLSVRDEGKGMSPEKVEQLFTRPLQETTSGTRGEKGSGIGFSIIKKLAELNGARLSVDSIAGKGTTVSIQFHSNTNDNKA
jgi:signal transduction histidine kinase